MWPHLHPGFWCLHMKLQELGCWWSLTSSDFLQPMPLLNPDSPHGLGVSRGFRGTQGSVQLFWFPLLMAESYCPHRNQFQGNLPMLKPGELHRGTSKTLLLCQPALSFPDRFCSSSRLKYPPLGVKHLQKFSKFYKLKKFFATQALLLPWRKGRVSVAKGESSLQNIFKNGPGGGSGDILLVFKSFKPKGGALI